MSSTDAVPAPAAAVDLFVEQARNYFTDVYNVDITREGDSLHFDFRHPCGRRIRMALRVDTGVFEQKLSQAMCAYEANCDRLEKEQFEMIRPYLQEAEDYFSDIAEKAKMKLIQKGNMICFDFFHNGQRIGVGFDINKPEPFEEQLEKVRQVYERQCRYFDIIIPKRDETRTPPPPTLSPAGIGAIAIGCFVLLHCLFKKHS